MKVYIIATPGRDGKPHCCLTGKWTDNGDRPASLGCRNILGAKRYSSMEEIEADPMTHTPMFWDVNKVYCYEEEEIAVMEEEARQEIRKNKELVEQMWKKDEED